MGSSTSDLYRKALALDESERAELAGALIDSLDSNRDPGVEASWLKEIERRIKELDSGEAEGIPWEEVRERILRRIDAADTD
jgi:putative addiction module component (TIGR02574 family)